MSGRHNGKLGTPTQRAAIRAEAYRMSLRGATNVAIGEHFGVSRETIRLLLKEYIAELTVPLAEDMRKIENDKLDRLEALGWKILEDNHVAFQHGKVVVMKDPETGQEKPIEDVEPILKGMDRLLKVSDRRAKLWGIDTPVKQESTVTHTTPFDAGIAAMVAEMAAMNDAERDSLSTD